MNFHKLIQFVLLYSILGLLIAFFVVEFWPEYTTQRPVVEIKESAADVSPKNLAEPASASIQKNAAGPVSYADAVKKAAPAIVNIYTAKVVTEQTRYADPVFQYFFGAPTPHKRMQTSLGSGVIMSEQGIILTNHHVVADATEIQVSLTDGRTANAKVIGVDPDTDLAALAINLNKLPAVVLGSSDQMDVGDVVLAIGNPFGVGQTVTMGIVSATGRDHVGLNTFENFIQTDAAINPGNSGGGLIDAYGNLIGINTAIFSQSGGSQGIGFAIPISLAKDVMKQLIEHGQVIRGWLGIETQNMTPAVAQSFGLSTTKGVLISGVLRQGPADLAGIEPGDLLTQINDTAIIDSRQALDLTSAMTPGSEVTLSGIHAGQSFRIKTTLIQRPLRQIQ